MLTAKLEEGARHFAAGRLEAAARAYRDAERIAPDDVRAAYSLAVIDIRQGRHARARRRLEALTSARPDHFMAQHNLAAVRQQLGDWTGAVEAYEAALASRPDAQESREALAIALAIVGRIEAAVAQHRILAKSPPRRWTALTRIALLDPAAIADDEVAGMLAAAADPALAAETRVGLAFGAGEALDQRGRGAEAFEAFALGNRVKHEALGPVVHEAAAINERTVAQLAARYTRSFIAANEGRGDRAHRPIFIVGFPRSGSTLLEQILASHPEVQGLGETGALTDLAAEALKPPRLKAGALGDLADRCLAALRRRGWDGRSRFVDKTLENYLHVGLIHLLFPRAVILHSVRDPMDACVSCFRQLFASGNETLYDLAGIGAEYRRYRAMMEHWRAVLPGRVIDVSYEALVADPEPQVRRLLADAGLEWHPAVLNFHHRGGAVRTASAVQVRRPISTGAVGRWRTHAAQLGPLIEALGPYGPAR